LRIRCERCATVYELDEKRLPTGGAAVKCTRCQHVFRAVPPELPAVPSVPPARPPVPTEERTAVFDFSRSAGPEQTASYATAPPPPPGPPVSHSLPHPRRAAPPPPASTRRSRWPWILAILLVLAAAIAASVWVASRNRRDGTAEREVDRLEGLLARDDRASLEQAASQAESHPTGDLHALRAMALRWLALDAAEEDAPVRARVRLLETHWQQEGETRAPGWKQRRDEVGSRLSLARREATSNEERQRRLHAEAAMADGAAQASGASDLWLLRARAVRQAVGSDPGLARTVREAAAVDASDPWVELARVLRSGAKGEPDIDALASLAARNPRLLRARLLLAQSLRATGREGESLRILDDLLAENGDHETAKSTKSEILAPPRAAVTRVDPGEGAPPVRSGGYLPRLKPRG